jgi:hypothetical protein
MNERSDDWWDEYHEDQHRRQLHGRLMQLPPGHPDAGDLEDALEDGNEPA